MTLTEAILIKQATDEVATMLRFIDQWITELDEAPRALAAMNAAEEQVKAQEAQHVSFE